MGSLNIFIAFLTHRIIHYFKDKSLISFILFLFLGFHSREESRGKPFVLPIFATFLATNICTYSMLTPQI